MIRYTRDAQLARAHLLRAYNDLIVFVEDEKCQNMHVRVLSRVVEGAGRISNVFPLGGRANVLAEALADSDDNPKRIYIIDGDLDLLTERNVPLCPRLHRLSAYSMENLVVTERGIIEVAIECAVDESESSLVARISFNDRKTFIVRTLLPLFQHYAVVSRLDLDIDTVSYSVVRLCERKEDVEVLCPRLVACRVRNVRRQIVEKVGWEAYRRTLGQVRQASGMQPDQSRLISGKDYLLPLVHAYLRSSLKLRDSFDGLRVRLARHFTPVQESSLRDFLLKALSSGFRLDGTKS